jgi:putative DNA primase/helicase
MPVESIEQRIRGMGADDDLSVLNHESLFHRVGKVLNLTNPEAQDAITKLCLRDNFKVLILDNISCLFNGMKENGADEWEMVLPWLLTLRRHRIAVVIVAHAGRNGLMRGTSRREDAAFSVIRLDEAQDAGTLKDGARFISRFTKDRNSRTEQPPIEWTFTTGADGKVSISTKQADGLAVLVEWVRDGLSSAREIAHEMGITPGTVSKMAKRAIEAGRLKKEGRGYAIA